jgi:hypothetical protein
VDRRRVCRHTTASRCCCCQWWCVITDTINNVSIIIIIIIDIDAQSQLADESTETQHVNNLTLTQELFAFIVRSI